MESRAYDCSPVENGNPFDCAVGARPRKDLIQSKESPSPRPVSARVDGALSPDPDREAIAIADQRTSLEQRPRKVPVYYILKRMGFGALAHPPRDLGKRWKGGLKCRSQPSVNPPFRDS